MAAGDGECIEGECGNASDRLRADQEEDGCGLDLGRGVGVAEGLGELGVAVFVAGNGRLAGLRWGKFSSVCMWRWLLHHLMNIVAVLRVVGPVAIQVSMSVWVAYPRSTLCSWSQLTNAMATVISCGRRRTHSCAIVEAVAGCHVKATDRRDVAWHR